MLLSEQLKKYVNAILAYDDEVKDIRDSKKEFKASFMNETGATKAELQFLDKAIQINKKLETNHEINDYVTFVEKVAELLARMAPGNEQSNEDNEEAPEAPNTESAQMEISFNGGEPIKTDLKDLDKVAEKLARPMVKNKAPAGWNPPPAPRVPN